MEEDIKILKNLLIDVESTLLDEEAMALEKLIKGYRELEAKVKRYEKYLDYKDKKFEKALEYEYQERETDYIPKSKIKEKIESCRRGLDDSNDGDFRHDLRQRIKILQELMEDK